MARPLGQDANRHRRRYLGSQRITDPGAGLGGSRPGRNRPKPEKLDAWRYGNKVKTKGKVEKRARRRLKAVGGVKGVNPKDGITGREARKIKRKWNREGRPMPGGGRPGGNRGRGPNRPVDPFASEVNALTELQYGGQQRELEAQRRISGQQQANLGGWYQQYQQDVLQAQQQQAAYTAGFQTAAYQQANQAAATDQTQGNQLLAQQQAQAAQRGMTVDPNVAQTMQQGQAARQTAGTQFGGMLAAQGQAQTGYLGNRVAVAGQQGLQAQQDEQRKRAQIDQLARDLQREMGAFKVKATADIQERKHTQRLENAAFLQGQQKLEADIADDLTDNAQEAREFNWKKRQNKAANRLAKAKLRSQNWKDKHKFELDRLADLSDDGRRNFSKTYTSGDTEAGSGGKDKGVPTSGPKKGLSESEQDKFDTAYDLLKRKGVGPKNAQDALAALIHDEHVPPRIAKRALQRWLRVRKKRRGAFEKGREGAKDFF